MSLWRGDIVWPLVFAPWADVNGRAYQVGFATLKASHGADGQPGLAEHWARESVEMAAAARSVGALVGGCHRLLPGNATAQVEVFLLALARIGGPAGRVCQLDCEAADPATVTGFVAEWNRATDSYPLIGYLPDWRESQWPASMLTSYGFAGWWASEYVPGDGTPDQLLARVTAAHWHPQDGVAPLILQYSSKATVAGVPGPCDVNVYRGTLAEMQAVATRC